MTDVLWKLSHLCPSLTSHMKNHIVLSGEHMELSALVLCNGLALQLLALSWHLERNCRTVEGQAQSLVYITVFSFLS